MWCNIYSTLAICVWDMYFPPEFFYLHLLDSAIIIHYSRLFFTIILLLLHFLFLDLYLTWSYFCLSLLLYRANSYKNQFGVNSRLVSRFILSISTFLFIFILFHFPSLVSFFILKKLFCIIVHNVALLS